MDDESCTFDYILNDLALYNLAVRCCYATDATDHDKKELLNQINLMQEQISKFKSNVYIKNEFPGLINDILLHVKSAEIQNQQLNDKFNNIKKFTKEKIGEYALQVLQNKEVDYKEELFRYDEELNKLLENEDN